MIKGSSPLADPLTGHEPELTSSTAGMNSCFFPGNLHLNKSQIEMTLQSWPLLTLACAFSVGQPPNGQPHFHVYPRRRASTSMKGMNQDNAQRTLLALLRPAARVFASRDPQAPANMVAESQKPQHELQDQKFPNLGEVSLSAHLSGAEIIRFGLNSGGTALPGIVVLVINATGRISLLLLLLLTLPPLCHQPHRRHQQHRQHQQQHY